MDVQKFLSQTGLAFLSFSQSLSLDLIRSHWFSVFLFLEKLRMRMQIEKWKKLRIVTRFKMPLTQFVLHDSHPKRARTLFLTVALGWRCRLASEFPCDVSPTIALQPSSSGQTWWSFISSMVNVQFCGGWKLAGLTRKQLTKHLCRFTLYKTHRSIYSRFGGCLAGANLTDHPCFACYHRSSDNDYLYFAAKKEWSKETINPCS